MLAYAYIFAEVEPMLTRSLRVLTQAAWQTAG